MLLSQEQNKYETKRLQAQNKARELEKFGKGEGISGFFKSLGTLNKVVVPVVD